MKITKAKKYLVDTDIELLNNMFGQLKETGVNNFEELIERMQQVGITSFDDLLAYCSGENCTNEMAIIMEDILERLRAAVPDRDSVLTSSNEMGLYLMDKLAGHKQEELWAIYIDNSNHIIAEKRLFVGTLNKSVAHPREIFRWAVIYACAGVFVVHNHPSGNVMPSENDIELTRIMNKAADVLHINFFDHFIVGKSNYLSMREHELF